MLYSHSHTTTQLIEDQTFGLKNKNKSKKVQQHIKSIEKSVAHSGDPKTRKAEEQRKKLKADAKARKKAQEDERNALFGEALMAVKKKSSTSKKDGKVEAKGRDGDDDAKKSGTSRAMKMCVCCRKMEWSIKVCIVMFLTYCPFHICIYCHNIIPKDVSNGRQGNGRTIKGRSQLCSNLGR